MFSPITGKSTRKRCCKKSRSKRFGNLRQGFSSIEELLQSKQASAKVVKEEPSGSQKPQKKEPKERKLPSHVKTLDEILKLKLIAEETSEKIGEIWNSYHSTRKALSACLTADFYKQLHAKGKQYPMFVLPLAREEGYEMFLLQFQGHQIYFTPLAEYQLNQENSRPLFELTFYTDLAEDKKIVLMLGEGIEKGPLGLKDAQHLVYQLQIFYVTGNEAQKDQVKKFWSDPSNFNYTQLIESLSTLG